MTTLSASQARARLYGLLDEAAESHQPIQISGKRNNAVLLSEEDWRAIQETLYRLSMPGMRESIRKGMKTPVGETIRVAYQTDGTRSPARRQSRGKSLAAGLRLLAPTCPPRR